MSIRDLIRYEKENMNHIRRIINYIVVPIYLLMMVLILITIGITMGIDEQKYTPLAIILFSAFGLLSIGLLILTPIVRKKEIKLELAKYDFESQFNYDEESFAVDPIAGFNENEMVVFNSKAIIVNDIPYKYDYFDIRFVSGHKLNKINLGIRFELQETNRRYLTFKLDAEILFIITKYHLALSNKEELDYLLKNKEDAFKQIYTYGYIRKIKN